LTLDRLFVRSFFAGIGIFGVLDLWGVIRNQALTSNAVLMLTWFIRSALNSQTARPSRKEERQKTN
jgi:hypothetical protein